MRVFCHTYSRFFVLLGAIVLFGGCAEVNVPESRSVSIPPPIAAAERKRAVNERPDSVMYLPLGEDVLVPEAIAGSSLPSDVVGPFELRSETLAGALQLILADYDIALAFETSEGTSRRITVTNLRGSLDKVVSRVCSLADLYCSYEGGAIVVKDTETFTVTLPPIGASGADGAEAEFLDDVSTGLAAILGGAAPIVDTTTRTIIYQATQRTSVMAARYFQRLRASTAMIVYEVYIWEVNLDSGNTVGVDWSMLDTFGNFNVDFGVDGNVGGNFTNPISIGLPTTKTIAATPTDMVQFLSTFGAVKSISQPQISVLSGSSAELRVANTENYVSEISTTLDGGGGSTTSVTTDGVDSGFTLSIGSTWDKSTVYADVSLQLTDVIQIDNFVFSDGGAGGTSTTIQLPQTTERELTTQIRVRPGDSVLIAGLVQEKDNFSKEGPGFMEPVLPQSRTAETDNLELVILLRPRVIVYSAKDESAPQAPVTTARSSAMIPAAALKAPVRQNVVPSASVSDSPSSLAFPSSEVSSSPATPVVDGGGSLSSSYAASETPTSRYVPLSEGRYKSGFKSKYLNQPQSPSLPAAGAPVAVSAPISSSGSVEIFDIDSGASVSGGGYSTYGAGSGY